MQEDTEETKKYTINLANEETWQLISTSETNKWLDKLSVVMGLNNYVKVDGPKIIFLRNIFDEHDIVKSLNLNEIRMWNTGSLRIYKCQDASNVICEIGNVDFPETEFFKMAQSVLPIYMRVMYQGGLPLHSALIEKEGIGIAIAAPGGTGKSTCARRIPSPWKALCDDETLIVRNKKGTYQAHPFPTWSRCKAQRLKETWDVQTHVPISAIFFLKRSQKDELNPLSFSKSASLIYELSLPIFNRILGFIDQNECTLIKKFIFENACDIAKDIPAFILEASLNGKFWEAINKELSEDPKRRVDARR